MTQSKTMSIDLSIVVPVLNEQTNIVSFLEQTVPQCEALQLVYELVFINDGSTDQTQVVLIDQISRVPQIKVVNLSRNFGKEVALTAGLDHASGQAVIPMDVDLQDPPELIGELYDKYQQGFDVVIAMRDCRDTDSFTKRFFAKLFHKLFNRMSDIETLEGAGDFRLMSRRVVDVVRAMPERTRFMKGMLSWPGFKTGYVTYDRPARDTGETKWRFSSLWKLALDGLFSFSTLPLKVWTYIGILLSLISVVYMLFTVLKTIVMGVDVPGYASLLSVMLLIGGVNLMGIGIIGEYISRIFIEVKGRPLYVIESVAVNQETQIAQDKD